MHVDHKKNIKKKVMRKTLFIIAAILLCTTTIAQKKNEEAKIKFEKTTIDMGTFPADSAIIECAFAYTNTGNAPLYIHRIYTSCGCTTSKFPMEPTMPNEKDTIFIKYDGTNKSPGYMRKSITVHCNTADEMIKLYIKGKMLPAKVEEIPQGDIEE